MKQASPCPDCIATAASSICWRTPGCIKRLYRDGAPLFKASKGPAFAASEALVPFAACKHTVHAAECKLLRRRLIRGKFALDLEGTEESSGQECCGRMIQLQEHGTPLCFYFVLY